MNFTHDELQHFYRYSMVLVKDEHLAYDLLQTALEKWCRGNDHSHVAHPKAYFMRMLKTQFIDDLRRDTSDKEIPFEEQEVVAEIGRDSLEDILITKEQLERALNLMGPAERELLFLWALEGYSTQEIAVHLDLPKGTILAKLYRVRKRIQKIFSNMSEKEIL